MMASLSMLQVYTGVVTLVFPSPLRLAVVWGVLGLVAGGFGFLAVWHCGGRFLVAASGALIVFACSARGLATLDRVTDDLVAGQVRAAVAVGTAQWWTIAYVTFVVWRRLVVPWSVLQSTERRAVPREDS